MVPACHTIMHCVAPRPRRRMLQRAGFTLTEILVATALTVVMLGMAVQIFALVSDGVRETRGVVEVNDRLRAASSRLQLDLGGITANLSRTPPLRVEDSEGYFEYIEGPIGPVLPTTAVDMTTGTPVVATSDVDEINNITLRSGADTYLDPDTTVGDIDDVLMFTTRSRDTPFIGKFQGEPVQSQVAEVCWFLRGTTLYRRVLLVLPDHAIPAPDAISPGFYANNDVSVRQLGGPNSRLATPLNTQAAARLVANTLGDLTNRQNRYGHQPWGWPYDARFWGRLGLPTLRECTYRVINVANPNTANMTRTPDAYQWPFPLQHTNTAFQDQGLTPNPGVPGPFALDPADRLIVPFWDRDPATGSLITGAAGQFALWPPATVPANVTPMLGRIVNFLPTVSGRVMDAWRSPNPWLETDPVTGGIKAFSGDPAPNNPSIEGESTRTLEDVVLTNVLSFDVKIWDPGAPIFLTVDGLGQLLSNRGDVLAAATAVVPPVVPANAGTIGPGDPAYVYQYAVASNPASLPPPAASVNSVLHRLCVDIAGAGNDISNGWLLPVGIGAYVDLNYMCRNNSVGGLSSTVLPIDYDEARRILLPINLRPLLPQPLFHWAGNPRSRLSGQAPTPYNSFLTTAQAAVYDTGSTSYEQDGINQDIDLDALVDEGANGADDNATNGIDDDLNGVIDDAGEAELDDPNEKEAPVPYPSPVRGIQVKIRIYDPDSRQIREVTVVQDFIK